MKKKTLTLTSHFLNIWISITKNIDPPCLLNAKQIGERQSKVVCFLRKTNKEIKRNIGFASLVILYLSLNVIF